MSKSQTPTSPTARGRRTRETILRAATDLFHSKGVHATSVDDILEASGTGKGQFYHHFGSKESLVRAALRDRADRVFESQGALLAGLGSWDGLRDWFEAMAASHDLRCCPGCPIGRIAYEMADHDPEVREEIERYFGRWRGHLGRGLSTMRAAGLLRADADPEALSEFCLAAIQGGILLAKTRGSVAPLRTVVDQLLGHLHSYGARPADRA
ncbi:TetR/AcrR family transcriptional regulator [Tautonia plasticadhaerens]|uniref:Putative HTH-type transcriptional regulator YxaF n=1 Tax=Tautonia plasticadhaerens TaxID=2527974 RepID=A0A518H4V9_9BACT|nr:TetR/AcrR family transcriptional regulator [Tautonia plasticadhaerens]QDV35857.1 putative HTH-type transcriptional regulator YxaF [Tautonia plasticadhaerens]